MKKILVFLILGIFLTSFAFAGITGSATGDENKKNVGNENKEITLTQSQVKEIVQERNKLRIHANESECPNNCSCDGSTTKCQLLAGREMTIQAGNSGNTIVQVKGVQARTQVQLYKEDGKLYGQFKNNITKRILSPEQIQEKIQERLQLRNCSCENITLDEDGNYQVQSQKQAKFLGLFKVREKIRFEYDAGNGELIKQQNSWWGFLARDVKEEPVLGATCGTVSPDSRNECCQNKGYDIYSETGDCIFSD